MKLETAQIGDLQMEIDIDADLDRVWTALTTDIGTWWPADGYTGGGDGKKNFVFEARPGGEMREEWENGGLLWGRVITCETKVRLQVFGTVFADWGGPHQWFGTWELAESGEKVKLTYRESVVGRIADDAIAEKEKGWSFLWRSLKAYLEGTAPPQWGE